MKYYVLLADKGYLPAKYQLELFTDATIKIEDLVRKNK
jgi:hypothetical protein